MEQKLNWEIEWRPRHYNVWWQLQVKGHQEATLILQEIPRHCWAMHNLIVQDGHSCSVQYVGCTKTSMKNFIYPLRPPMAILFLCLRTQYSELRTQCRQSWKLSEGSWEHNEGSWKHSEGSWERSEGSWGCSERSWGHTVNSRGCTQWKQLRTYSERRTPIWQWLHKATDFVENSKF